MKMKIISAPAIAAEEQMNEWIAANNATAVIVNVWVTATDMATTIAFVYRELVKPATETTQAVYE